MAAAGAGAAITMRRRYASATAEAKNATESSEDEQRGTQAGDRTDAAAGSEVNGRSPRPARSGSRHPRPGNQLQEAPAALLVTLTA